MKIKDEYRLKKMGITKGEIKEIAHQWYVKYGVSSSIIIQTMRERYGVELKGNDLTWT